MTPFFRVISTNSVLFFVLANRSRIRSTVSSGFCVLVALWTISTASASADERSRSSLRVPERRISSAGKMRSRKVCGQAPAPCCRSLKFLVNNIVHTAARLNQRGRQNRQAAALAYISRRTEEALRHMQRCRIQPPERVRPLGGTTRL